MSLDKTRPLRALPLGRATLQGGLLGTVQERVIEKTLPAIAQKLEEVGVFRALEAAATGEKVYVHPFWDSDVGKWLEAVSYGMVRVPDLASRLPVERAIRLLAAAQDKNGYLNSYYTVVEPDQRFQQLAFGHELYNAGHLIEGAVAHYEATGRRDFLDIVIRYADHIYDVFGPGKRIGYPGHPEIELALVKLYRVTGDRRYLELSKAFLERRGRKPSIFESEIGRLSPRHEEWFRRLFHLGERFSTEYCQDHMPVKEQREAVGHAVRAMYLYSGMVDVAVETGDEELLAAARRLWEDVVTRRMYITGGIGSSEANEGFTGPYDLPNQTAYAETCAAIGLVFLSHRLLQIEPHRRYADVMERALYNAVLGGVSLDGAHFAYDTPLACSASHRRQPWFEVACCPPNLARLILSLGKYVASERDGELYVHLYTPGEYVAHVGDQAVRLRVETNYPWDGHIGLGIEPEKPGTFAVHCRIPGWAREASVSVNGVAVGGDVGGPRNGASANGYITIERE